MNTINYFDDEPRQIELVPGSAVATTASYDDRMELRVWDMPLWDGERWSTVFVRRDLSGCVQTLGLSATLLSELIGGQLTRFDAVYSGSTSHPVPCRQTVGWGDGSGNALFAELSEAGSVESLWLWNRFFPASTLERWVSTLGALGSWSPFFIVDSPWWLVVDCLNPTAVRACLRGELDSPAAN